MGGVETTGAMREAETERRKEHLEKRMQRRRGGKNIWRRRCREMVTEERKRAEERDQLSKEQLETNHIMSQANTQTVSSTIPSATKVLAFNQL